MGERVAVGGVQRVELGARWEAAVGRRERDLRITGEAAPFLDEGLGDDGPHRAGRSKAILGN